MPCGTISDAMGKSLDVWVSWVILYLTGSVPNRPYGRVFARVDS